MRVYKKEADIVIGARSALFAPLNRLGVIVIDEEHEDSYISTTSPKYDTMEVAVKMAYMMDGKVILGSATPSLNTYYMAMKGQIEMCIRDRAVKNLLTMRVKEGIQLKDDISLSLVKIRELMKVIFENSHTIVEDYKIKFEDRIKELLGNTHELDENRLYNEIVIYADKSDINEEIVRFNSHMKMCIRDRYMEM